MTYAQRLGQLLAPEVPEQRVLPLRSGCGRCGDGREPFRFVRHRADWLPEVVLLCRGCAGRMPA